MCQRTRCQRMHRYFSVARGALISVRSNGVICAVRSTTTGRCCLESRRNACSQWVANKKASLRSLHRWQLEVGELPSLQELMAWNEDGIAKHRPATRRARRNRTRWRAFLASFDALDLTHLATTSTTMIDTPCLAFSRRYVVQASKSGPATRHVHERDILADCEIHVTRTEANQCARVFLRRGHWVEVYDETPRKCWPGLLTPTEPPHKSSEITKPTKGFDARSRCRTLEENHDRHPLSEQKPALHVRGGGCAQVSPQLRARGSCCTRRRVVGRRVQRLELLTRPRGHLPRHHRKTGASVMKEDSSLCAKTDCRLTYGCLLDCTALFGALPRRRGPMPRSLRRWAAGPLLKK
jgi:hypothetical protein